MPISSSDLRGYVLTGVIVVGLLAFGVLAVWVMAHPQRNPAYRSEWRCISSFEVGDVCERRVRPQEVRPAPRPPTEAEPGT